MQRTSRHEFLHNVGYGALSLPIRGHLSLVPLVNPGLLPPIARPLDPLGSIEEQATALLKGYNVPGIAIGLIRANKLVYARGFGLQNVATRRRMTEYSMMAVASMSKMFTGAAIMQLQEAGRLSLDDTFVKHVPYFKMADPRYKSITIRHLLAHTSGLPEVTPADFHRQINDPWYDDDAAERLVRSLDGGLMLSQDPGGTNAVFRYSDIGYDILAALIHEVTGELFEDYQRHHILDPLHMFKSTFLMSQVKTRDLAAAHVRNSSGNPIVWERYPYARQLGPSSCLFTNIVEMSNWIITHFNGGLSYNRIMRPETQALLWQPLYHDPWDWIGTGYSSGFFSMSYAESGIEPVRMVICGGGMPGVCTHATLFPDQGVAAIVFINLRATPKDPAYSWGICDNLAIRLLHGELQGL